LLKISAMGKVNFIRLFSILSLLCCAKGKQ
jgi:hypothetical protein